MKTANKFSVKGTVYVNTHKSSRGKSVDGPWKATPAEAVEAYAEMLREKGLLDKPVFQSFLAERCSKDESSSGDSQGASYREATVENFDRMLTEAGVNIGDLHRRG